MRLRSIWALAAGVWLAVGAMGASMQLAYITRQYPRIAYDGYAENRNVALLSILGGPGSIIGVANIYNKKYEQDEYRGFHGFMIPGESAKQEARRLQERARNS